jgi:hypothetical protein
MKLPSVLDERGQGVNGAHILAWARNGNQVSRFWDTLMPPPGNWGLIIT